MLFLPLLTNYAVCVMILVGMVGGVVVAGEVGGISPDVRQRVGVAYENLDDITKNIDALHKEIVTLQEEDNGQKETIAQLTTNMKLYEEAYEKMSQDLERAQLDMNYKEVQALKGQLAVKEREIGKLKETESYATSCANVAQELAKSQIQEATEPLNQKIHALEKQNEVAVLACATTKDQLKTCMEQQQEKSAHLCSVLPEVQEKFDVLMGAWDKVLSAVGAVNYAVAQAFVQQARRDARSSSITIDEVVVASKKLPVTEAQDALKKAIKDGERTIEVFEIAVKDSSIVLPAVYQQVYLAIKKQNTQLLASVGHAGGAREAALSRPTVLTVPLTPTAADKRKSSSVSPTHGNDISSTIVGLNTQLAGKKSMQRQKKGNLQEVARAIADITSELRKAIPVRLAEIENKLLLDPTNSSLLTEQERLQHQLTSFDLASVDL